MQSIERTTQELARIDFRGHKFITGKAAAQIGAQLLETAAECGAQILHMRPETPDASDVLQAFIDSPRNAGKLVVILITDYATGVDQRLYALKESYALAHEPLRQKVRLFLERGQQQGVWLIVTDSGTDSPEHAFNTTELGYFAD